MSIASQIKEFHAQGNTYDYDALIAECEEKGEVDQDWVDESTKFVFADGSVIIIAGPHVSAYEQE